MNNAVGANSRAEVRLPKITLPYFHGDYTEWQSFFDLFCSTIHDNVTLTQSQKLQYLKGALKGEAAVLLKHFSITEANYIEALTKLKDRYDRKRHTVYAFIKTFISQPNLSAANSANIRKMLDTSDEVVRGLKAMGEKAESRDHWLIYLLTCKLDDETNGLWARASSEYEFPTLQQFFMFLSKTIDALESMRNTVKRSNPQPNQPKANLSMKAHVSTTSDPCPLCPEQCHRLFECSKLIELSVVQRRELMKKHNRCFNCFNDNHSVYQCRSKFRCTLCNRKHHTILHEDAPANATETRSSLPVSQSNDSDVTSVNYHTATKKGTTILPTALVHVLDGNNQKQQCRVLLDSGSQASFVTESCIQRLLLNRRNAKIPVSGIGDSKTGHTKGMTSLVITPRSKNTPCFQIEALILTKLTSKQPSTSLAALDLPYFNQFELADPHFYQSADIDILIGSDHFFDLLQEERILEDHLRPTMQKSFFGWIVAGKFDESKSVHSLTVTSAPEEENLDHLLKMFWEVESITSTSKPMYSEEEQFCETHFQNTKQEDESGCLIVRLPFNAPPNILGDSIGVAIQRMRAMERKLAKNEEFCAMYKEFIDEYIKLGHMKEITFAEQQLPGYYLPHHGIIKPSSTTTKLRVVFNDSAKTTSGKALNDCLAVGPTLQANLYHILCHFREFRVAFTSDVEKMFRQVRVAKEDTKYTNELYGEIIRSYGTSSAPFLATRALLEGSTTSRPIPGSS